MAFWLYPSRESQAILSSCWCSSWISSLILEHGCNLLYISHMSYLQDIFPFYHHVSTHIYFIIYLYTHIYIIIYIIYIYIIYIHTCVCVCMNFMCIYIYCFLRIPTAQPWPGPGPGHRWSTRTATSRWWRVKNCRPSSWRHPQVRQNRFGDGSKAGSKAVNLSHMNWWIPSGKLT